MLEIYRRKFYTQGQLVGRVTLDGYKPKGVIAKELKPHLKALGKECYFALHSGFDMPAVCNFGLAGYLIVPVDPKLPPPLPAQRAAKLAHSR